MVKRSVMERFSLARYFPLYWHRTQPLWGCHSTEPFTVREQGVQESSHVRANECPYSAFHGMSLSGGTHADEGLAQEKAMRRRQSCILMEMQWIRDPAANIENWFLTDIEKILQEAWQLNPHGPKEMHLPGEMFVVVGQNPKVGSSIKETQHTQLYEGALSTYPVMQLTANPRYFERLSAWVDVVPVGPMKTDDAEAEAMLNAAAGEAGEESPEDQHGIFVRITTQRPTAPELVEFLVQLRLCLLAKFGGGQTLDFLVLAMSDEKGGFVVLFAPIPQLVKLGDEKPDFASWANPLTGESSDVVGLEEARVDVGKGVGHFLVSKTALREQLLSDGEGTLRRVWAFNRVPGLRAAVDGFVAQWRAFGED